MNNDKHAAECEGTLRSRLRNNNNWFDIGSAVLTQGMVKQAKIKGNDYFHQDIIVFYKSFTHANTIKVMFNEKNMHKQVFQRHQCIVS